MSDILPNVDQISHKLHGIYFYSFYFVAMTRFNTVLRLKESNTSM